MTEDPNARGAAGLPRLFVEAALAAGVNVDLPESQAHYLRNVMRLGPGDDVLLFNGRDGEWRASLAFDGKRRATARLDERTRAQTAVPDLWLVFAPVKRTPADFIAQKATELGVAMLQPVITQRTVVTRVNLDRLRANAVEAAEQCERLSVPEIADAAPLERLLSGWDQTRRILYCDEGGAPPASVALKSEPRGPWAVLTGPEGGFSPAERERIRKLPCVVPVSLGPRILRADTAAIAALTLWQAALGDLVE